MLKPGEYVRDQDGIVVTVYPDNSVTLAGDSEVYKLQSVADRVTLGEWELKSVDSSGQRCKWEYQGVDRPEFGRLCSWIKLRRDTAKLPSSLPSPPTIVAEPTIATPASRDFDHMIRMINTLPLPNLGDNDRMKSHLSVIERLAKSVGVIRPGGDIVEQLEVPFLLKVVASLVGTPSHAYANQIIAVDFSWKGLRSMLDNQYGRADCLKQSRDIKLKALQLKSVGEIDSFLIGASTVLALNKEVGEEQGDTVKTLFSRLPDSIRTICLEEIFNITGDVVQWSSYPWSELHPGRELYGSFKDKFLSEIIRQKCLIQHESNQLSKQQILTQPHANGGYSTGLGRIQERGDEHSSDAISRWAKSYRNRSMVGGKACRIEGATEQIVATGALFKVGKTRSGLPYFVVVSDDSPEDHKAKLAPLEAANFTIKEFRVDGYTAEVAGNQGK